MSCSDLEVNRVTAPPEIGFTFVEGVGGDDLSGLVQPASGFLCLPFKYACDKGFSAHLGGSIN